MFRILGGHYLFLLLTQKLQNSSLAKNKTGAVFVDLTLVYDTVWHRDLTCKLLRILPDRHMVSLIRELVRNVSFTLATGAGKQADCDALQMAFHKDQSWLSFCLISIYYI